MIRLKELELVFGHTTDGWTDRRDVGNSILDVPNFSCKHYLGLKNHTNYEYMPWLNLMAELLAITRNNTEHRICPHVNYVLKQQLKLP